MAENMAAPTGVEAQPGLEKAVSRNSRKAGVGPVVEGNEVLAGEADAELLGMFLYFPRSFIL